MAIEIELRQAYKEHEQAMHDFNNADKSYIDVAIYKLKSIDIKIEKLKKQIEGENKNEY